MPDEETRRLEEETKQLLCRVEIPKRRFTKTRLFYAAMQRAAT